MKRLAVALLVSLLCSCNNNDVSAPDERRIEVVSGANQVAGAATALQQVSVRVVVNGQPAAGAQVQWNAFEGGGAASPSVSVTDANGVASTTWTLGNDDGQQLLMAVSGNARVTIAATSITTFGYVAAGYKHTCALTTIGNVYCWGENQQGQLGTDKVFTSATALRVNTQLRFVKVAAGWAHTCGITRIGELYCWGDNSAGQLGSMKIARSYTPVLTGDGFLYSDVSTGFVHTCGVTTTGIARCWGTNERGQLGQPLNNSASISAGEFHSCAVRAGGALWCWGWNSNGELGTNSPRDVVNPTPMQVFGGRSYKQVATGPRHTCAVATDGKVYCWGLNGRGETGQPVFFHSPIPEYVQGADNFTSVGIGNEHTCGLSGGKAYCWGGLLGNGTTSTSRTPVAVSGNLSFDMLSVGYANTCGISGGAVYCWSPAVLTPTRVTITP